MAQKGTITVSKSGEVFFSVSENKGIYLPIYKVSGLAGATYQITAAEDIITQDGKTYKAENKAGVGFINIAAGWFIKNRQDIV